MYERNLDAHALILYADHNPDDRVLVKEALADISPEVRIVSVPDGKTLLDYLFLNSQTKDDSPALLPDAILLEINMPKKGGVEALCAIKRDRRTSHIPVIIFSTYTSERERRKALKLGADLFVRKPRSFEKLKATLRAITEQVTKAETPASGYRAFPRLDSVSR
jgi:CheY-like chemotaxis protein